MMARNGRILYGYVWFSLTDVVAILPTDMTAHALRSDREEMLPPGLYKASVWLGRPFHHIVQVKEQIEDINAEVARLMQMSNAPLNKYRTDAPGIKGNLESERLVNEAAYRRKKRTGYMALELQKLLLTKSNEVEEGRS